jgi:galactosylceramidase
MTGTIAWNLIASYYEGLPYTGDGLMTAMHPWTGHYEVKSPIWATAHTTQFTQPGWIYLKYGYGVGQLQAGGSYVSLISPDSKDLTIVIETLSHDHSVCIRPRLPRYNVTNQTATFQLKGNFSYIKTLHLWKTHLDYTSNSSVFFEKLSDVEVTDGSFMLSLDVDSIWTLSTMTGQQKGNYGTVPNAAPFFLPYKDNFDSYVEHSEANNFADQSGVFEIYNSGSSRGMVMRQMVIQRPITWCNDADQPISVLGDHTWQDVNVTVDAMIEEKTSVFVAARVGSGGCRIAGANGFFLWLSSDGPFTITSDLGGKNVLDTGSGHGKTGQWYTLSVHIQVLLLRVHLVTCGRFRLLNT